MAADEDDNGGLTHFDASGQARMVNVGGKVESMRVAVASARVLMAEQTALLIAQGEVEKGDVLGIARVAAIQALKKTSELIPLCHPIRVTGVDVDFEVTATPPAQVRVRASVSAFDRTGVEMEALTAVTVAALTIYDMCKSVDRGMEITDVRVDEKRGGRSGAWRHPKSG